MSLLLVLVVLATGCGDDSLASTTTASTATTVATTASTTPPPPTTTTSTSDETTTSERPAGDVGDLLVVGDWGSGNIPQGAVAGAMMRYAEVSDVEAILTTGDNLYSDEVDFLMHPFEWAIEAGIPFWITWGNHDVSSADRIEAINETFDGPPRWTTHSWGEVEIVILDSTQLDSDEQIDFLTETLAASDLPTVVVFHHPPYSCGSHGDTEKIQDDWLSLFDDDVFLVLSGHEHNYQRFEDSNSTYVVTGGGGAGLTELSSCPTDHPTRASGESIHHFLVMGQDDGIVVSVIDVNGNTVDEFSLSTP